MQKLIMGMQNLMLNLLTKQIHDCDWWSCGDGAEEQRVRSRPTIRYRDPPPPPAPARCFWDEPYRSSTSNMVGCISRSLW